MNKVELTNAEINHLRRLLGWVRCEIGPSPEEHKDILRKIAPAFTDGISEEGQINLLASHKKYENVPKYIRAAVKSLEKTLNSAPIDIQIQDKEKFLDDNGVKHDTHIKT